MRWIVAIAGMLLVACGNGNDASVDGSTNCTSSDECSDPTGVCDATGSMKCVECTTAEHAACAGASPACIENICQACTSHTQCDSAACLPDGTCALETDVAYLSQGASGSSCTRAAPCGTLDEAVNMNKPLVKIAAGLVADSKVTTIDGKQITILADPGAKLGRNGSGEILNVTGGSDVKIFDLEVTRANGILSSSGALSVSSTGVMTKLALTRVKVTDIGGNGIIVTFGGQLTVSRSLISGNMGSGIKAAGGALTVEESIASDNVGNGIIASGSSVEVSGSTLTRNASAGISAADGVVSIINNFIVRNGGNANPGGVQLANLSTGSKVEFNTITDNVGRDETNSTGGVSCYSQGFIANNNIIFRNRAGTSSVQTLGTCTYGNSIVMAGTSPTDNALNFVNPNTDPFDYHLSATSQAVDAAGACTGNDVDDDVRPIGNACDLGADEFRP